MRMFFILLGLMVAGGTFFAFAEMSGQSGGKEDVEGIKAACLDYVEGFYEADKARMERGVHPDLVKRRLKENTIVEMTRPQLIEVSGRFHRAKPEIKVEVLDVFKEIAMAKVTSDFVDYAQLGKVDGRWKVINVIWTKK